MSISTKIVHDDTQKVLTTADGAIEKALNEIGLTMERGAKKYEKRVDTGLLRNSITYALDGSGAHAAEYQADKGGKGGRYHGTTPSEGGRKRAVYVGTNVEYAPFIEKGTSKMKATPFLMPAVNEQKDKFKAILKKNLENA